MPANLPGRWLWPGLALLAGIAGMSAIWVAAAVLSGASCSWFGLVAAADMALLLRLTHAPAGAARVLAAVLATLATIVSAQWLVAATQLGVVLGMPPIASALHLGPHLAWQLTGLALDRVDWVLLGAAPLLAAILVPAPAVTEPAVAEPAVTEPAVTEPAVTEPSAPNPGTSAR
jgi:hypothetical protein